MSTNPPEQSPEGIPPYTPPPYTPQASPPYAPATPSIEYASIGVRFVAVLLDGLIIGIPLLIISLILSFYSSPLAAVINALAYFLYEGLMLFYQNGQTIGKKLMSIRVVSVDGQPLTMNKTFTRSGVKAVLSVLSSIKPPVTSILGILSLLDYLWPFWDANKQTWHDKAAGTYVVKA
jgi:uncharacterized RDD family membrane protein YckC